MSQRTKPRVFSSDYKKHAVERMLAGESGSALARELQVRRKLLYEWKDAYLVGGVKALRPQGRPRKGETLGFPPQVGSGRGEIEWVVSLQSTIAIVYGGEHRSCTASTDMG